MIIGLERSPRRHGLAGPGLNAALAAACLCLALVLPAAALFALWTAPAGAGPLAASGTLAPWQAALSLLINMVPVSCIACGLLHARRCLLGLGRGDIFGLCTVRHLRGLAGGLFAAALAGLASPTLAGLVLTANAPPGRHALVVDVNSQAVLMLVFAGIVWQIAQVMTRAAELADEHAQIV